MEFTQPAAEAAPKPCGLAAVDAPAGPTSRCPGMGRGPSELDYFGAVLLLHTLFLRVKRSTTLFVAVHAKIPSIIPAGLKSAHRVWHQLQMRQLFQPPARQKLSPRMANWRTRIQENKQEDTVCSFILAFHTFPSLSYYIHSLMFFSSRTTGTTGWIGA